MARFSICLVFVSLSIAALRPAYADVADVYDTVDAVEMSARTNNDDRTALQVTGIPTGQTTPVTRTYIFIDTHHDVVIQCQRLAVLVMSKPGKFRFGIGNPGFPSGGKGCKLILRNP